MRVAFPNLGAEEGIELPPQKRAPGSPVANLIDAFEDIVRDPPWSWLEDARGLVPWLATARAREEAKLRGLPLWGPAPEVVARVHDKAFTAGIARTLDDVGPVLVVLPPDGVSPWRIEQAVAAWPEWARASFTVKPRWGTSGRGRIAGANGLLAHHARGGHASIARLAQRGGAVVEPWLARTMDLSSQWFVDEHGEPHLLGVTQQVTRGAGVYLGCDVVGGPRDGLRIGSGTRYDEPVVEKGRVVVEAAAAEGFRGPCGVDAFVYKDHEDHLRLRGAVELNARFTAGHTALALVERRGIAPGERLRVRLDRPLLGVEP